MSNNSLDSSSSPTVRVISLFRSIQKILREQVFEKSKEFGFTGPQMLLIFTLAHKPYSTLNELSEQLNLSKSTVSGIVDRLVAQGVVVREIPTDNRRIVKLSISPDFFNNNNLTELKNKYFSDIFADANPEDIEKIISGLEILYALMSKSAPK